MIERMKCCDNCRHFNSFYRVCEHNKSQHVDILKIAKTDACRRREEFDGSLDYWELKL